MLWARTVCSSLLTGKWWHDASVRVRVDRLPNELGSPPRAGRPCAGARRHQSMRKGRLESWWEVDVDDLDSFLDLLRRCEGRSAVVEFSHSEPDHPDVRVWIPEAPCQHVAKSSGPRTRGP